MGSCDALAIVLSVQASQLFEQAWCMHSSIYTALTILCIEDDTLAHQTLQARLKLFQKCTTASGRIAGHTCIAKLQRQLPPGNIHVENAA